MCDRLLQLQSGCHHQKLLSAMWELKTSGTLCDVTVQVDYEGELEEFEAHQVVLAASSGYFKSILLAKDNIRKIFMCDIPPNAFSKFLEYVYSGKMEIEEDLLATVIQLAKHLDCQDLIDLCESLKTPSVDPEESPNIEENMQPQVKTKHVKKQIKRSSFKVPESPKGPELDVLDRKSSRLAGRRVSVEFPSEIPDESDVAEEDKSSLDTNDANGDTEMDSHYSLPDVPEEDSDEPEKLEKEKGSTKFRCMNCSRFFYYEKSYQKHLRIVHGVQLDTVFCCDICNQTFANRNNLKIHQRHVHNDDRLFSCDICSKSFKRKKDVTRHRRQVHEGGSNRHFCCVCGKSLSSKTALTLHERTHSGHKPYKCDICGSKFSQSSALKTHKRIHTGEKPFACDICGARFTQNHMLSYHRRCHTGEKPFMCEHCGKSFASKEYLKHHNRIHSGFRPYKCEMCDRAFAQRNSLHQHMKTHTGERPYHCNQCDKQFTQLNALQRHQRIHTGEKPYMCSMCGRTFTDKSTVRRHTLTHDKLTPWKNFLVVLDGNVEDRASKPKVSQKKNKEPTPLDVTDQQTNADKVQDVVAVSGQPVTITGDWAGPGTIALVNHPSLGGLTVIHTDVTAGTQVQPLVTTDGTSVISLDGSSVGMPVTVPFTIPISVAHSISPSISVPITVPSVSDEVNVKAKDSETVLAPAHDPRSPDPSIGHTQHPISEQEVGERTADASNIVEVSI